MTRLEQIEERKNENNELAEVVANRLCTLIDAAAVTQEAVAKGIDVRQPYIPKLRSGRYVPEIATLLKLADYFDVSLDYLCGRTEENEETLVQFKKNFKDIRLKRYEANLVGSCESIHNIPWPYNLCYAVLGRSLGHPLSENQKKELETAICCGLTMRDVTIIYDRYRDGLTLKQLAQRYELSRERIRIRLIKAERKLRTSFHAILFDEQNALESKANTDE